MKEQKHTSKRTSINSKTVPAGMKLIQPKGFVLDYGCGKYFMMNMEYCIRKGAKCYTPYDPYQLGTDIDLSENDNYYDTIYCTNVLNVIDSNDVIENIIGNVCRLLAINGTAIFTMYEGDGTGIGKETMEDCWQRNAKTKAYRWFFYNRVPINFDITVTSKYITLKRVY